MFIYRLVGIAKLERAEGKSLAPAGFPTGGGDGDGPEAMPWWMKNLFEMGGKDGKPPPDAGDPDGDSSTTSSDGCTSRPAAASCARTASCCWALEAAIFCALNKLSDLLRCAACVCRSVHVCR